MRCAVGRIKVRSNDAADIADHDDDSDGDGAYGEVRKVNGGPANHGGCLQGHANRNNKQSTVQGYRAVVVVVMRSSSSPPKPRVIIIIIITYPSGDEGKEA